MKRNVLCINIGSAYHDPPRPLNGKNTGTHGMAFWSPSHNAQVCRVPEEKWSSKIHTDILLFAAIRGNTWAIIDEFVCEDGTAFEFLHEALAHEKAPKVEESAQTVIPSGIPVTIEAVEKAGSAKLRELARSAGMPNFRKFSKADELRPELIAFLQAQAVPAEVEEQQAEAV